VASSPNARDQMGNGNKNDRARANQAGRSRVLT
jgi:hypothetical protein